MEPSTTYVVAWLAAALLAIGALSWMLVRHMGRLDLRRQQAGRLIEALQRYSERVCAQRLTTVFQGEDPGAAAALDEACSIRRTWFPELAGDMAELLAEHNRMQTFLATQQTLWLRDPEHWLESEHDKRFMALWRQHRLAMQALLEKLERATSIRIRTSAPPRASTYA